MTRWRGLGVASLVLLVGAVGLWLGADRWPAPSPTAATSTDKASPGEPKEHPPGPAWALASLASRAADAAHRPLILDAAELQRLDEADCARMAPALDKLQPGQMPDGPEFEWYEGDEHQAWLRRWIHALRQRSDERSLAAADFLEPLLALHDDAGAWVPSTQRLHRRALQSGDGFVLALAAARPCDPALGCKQPVPPERWPQLEPGNLSAWLAAPPKSQPAPEAWLNGVAQTSQDNSHRAELMALLLSLPPQLPPGPRRLARDLALVGINAAFLIPSYRPLTQHCRGGEDAERCRLLAEKLWNRTEPDLINWTMALTLARQAPPIAPVWESRARLAEAASQWSRDEAVGMIAEPLVRAFRCQAEPVFDRWAHAMLTAGEGTALMGEIKVRGLVIDSLSAKYRQEHGRSLLQASK